MDVVVLIVIGLVSGFLAGLLGAGGGFATVVLLLAAGLSAHQAVGTSLVYTVVIGAWGTFLHLRKGTASAWLALALGLPSAATALLGAQLGDRMDEKTLVLAFAALTLVVGFAFLIRRSPAVEHVEDDVLPIAGAQHVARPASLVRPNSRIVGFAVAGGGVIGILKGLFGVGGGFLLVPFMVLALKIPEHVAVGSSLFAILLGSIVGGIKHITLGNVVGADLAWLIPGGLVGSFVGAALVHRVAAVTIRRAFVVLMFVSAAYLLFKGL